MADRVAVISPEGQFGTVDSVDAEAVTRAGGRVLTRAEVKAQETQEAYDKQSAGTKIATVASMAGPIAYPLHAYLRGQGAVLPPELESYTQGVSSGFTGGVASVGMKEIARASGDAAAVVAPAIGLGEYVRAAGGDEAARAYGQTAKDVVEAHAGLHTAGEIAGFLGGAVAGGGKAGLGAAGKIIPGVGISALGGVAEQGAARVLAPIAARGAVGRALATGGELAARGAVEGALYGGASQVTEDMLGDHTVAADKVFAAMGTGALFGGAGGAVLGGAGSLAASGAKATLGAARSSIGKALTRGTDVAADVAAKADAASAEATGLAKEAVAAAKPQAEVGALRQMLQGDAEGGARSAANQLGFDALNATKTVAKGINDEVKGGTKAVGEWVNRRVLNLGEEATTLVGTVRGGRADSLLPRIAEQNAITGSQIGDLVKATPVAVKVDDLLIHADRIAKEMASDPTRIQGSQAFRDRVGQTFEAFANGGKLSPTGTMDLSEMYYARAKMESVAYEMKLGNNAAGDAMKEWLREVDSTLVGKLDEAAKAAGAPDVGVQLRNLKREYQLGMSAEKAATEGTNRIAGNNAFGIREGIGAMAGLATGHPIAALGTALAGKAMRERGSAAGAYLLTRLADMGTLTRAVAAVDEQVGKAAKGLLTAPGKRPLPAATSTEPLRVRAQRIMDAVAEHQANPEGMVDRITRSTEPLQSSAPNIAGALTQRMTSAMAFMASKIPVHADPDPFDPHPAARLTDAQAATVVRYASYVERPMRFFEELEHGKLTYEGVEVAKALMPGPFAELQQRTVEGLTDLMSRGQKPPYAQRDRLGILLDIPATPAQRPDHMKLLQFNVATTAAQGPSKGSGGGPGAPASPSRPLPNKSQPSPLDRLEGR